MAHMRHSLWIKVIDDRWDTIGDFDMAMSSELDKVGMAMETAWFSATANLERRIRNFWLTKKILPFR